MEPASAIHILRIDDILVALDARPLGRGIRVWRATRFEYGHSGRFSVAWVELGWLRVRRVGALTLRGNFATRPHAHVHRLNFLSYQAYASSISRKQILECIEGTELSLGLT